MVEVGKRAPSFTLKDQHGQQVKLSDARGKKVVLYFYPRDNTAGCTQEAKDFTEIHAELEGAGAVVWGVSPDSQSSHAKFAAKHDLPFQLLVDEAHSCADAYGVWQEKRLYGRKFMGVVRTTVLIDEAGKVAHVWSKVRVPGHAAEVRQAVLEGVDALVAAKSTKKATAKKKTAKKKATAKKSAAKKSAAKKKAPAKKKPAAKKATAKKKTAKKKTAK